MNQQILIALATSLGLGLLVGLQRQSVKSELAGIRTFPLVTLSGSITALLAERSESYWLIGAGLIAVGLLVASTNFLRPHSSSDNEVDIGQTTEIAILLMFLVGAVAMIGPPAVAVVTGGCVAVLLALKRFLHRTADRLAAEDMRAIMQFAAIAFIVLPILPNENYGPYSVLNPREIWTMVALIVGLSVVAYFVFKWVGTSVGTIAGGILGGLISSTATTVTYAKRTANSEGGARLAAMVILIASTVSFVRVLVEVGVVIPGKLGVIAPPVAAMIVAMALICLGLYFFNNEEEDDELPDPDNPAQLKAALIFGALYALIIFAVAVAKDYLGQQGLYILAVVSGLTDVDAITLSLSNTIADGGLSAERGWGLILVAALSNMGFKAAMAAVLGSRRLAVYIVSATALIIAIGLALVFFWPAHWAWS